MNSPNHFFFDEPLDKQIGGVVYKNFLLKKRIIHYLDKNGNRTISDISKNLFVSIPKINDLIKGMIKDGLVKNAGKMEAGVGRRPQLFGLITDSLYFLGIDINNNSIDIGLVNFNEEFVFIETDLPFELKNTEESLDRLCTIIEKFINRNDWKEKIISLGISISGRVNELTGFSHNFFNFFEKPLTLIFKERFGIHTFIENDTRSKAFAEFHRKRFHTLRNILYINADYGLGMGALVNGQLQYGKSGYSGEFGHIPFFENEIICRCGKKGCLETEASGRALVQMFRDQLDSGFSSLLQEKVSNHENIQMSDIIRAANADDMLAIELIGKIGSKLGKGVAALIHLYNPELIIIGGALSRSGDHLFLPLQMAVNKFSLNRVKKDSPLQLSEFGEGAGVWGVCLLAKKKIINIKD